MDVGWSPSPISPERPQQSSRPSYSKSRQNSLNTTIVDSESSRHGSRPSVSSEASKARQKHIWEMQSPSSSRGGSPSRHRSRISQGGAQPTIPEIPTEAAPSTAESQVPTPTASPGPEGRRRHIWELQSPGGSRGNSRKHSRVGMRDSAATASSAGAGTGGVHGATAALAQMAGVDSIDDADAMPGTAI
jgi:hypothetical protein